MVNRETERNVNDDVEVLAQPEAEKRIREIAFGIWEQDGRPEGHADEHWQEAQRRVAAQSDYSTRNDIEVRRLR